MRGASLEFIVQMAGVERPDDSFGFASLERKKKRDVDRVRPIEKARRCTMVSHQCEPFGVVMLSGCISRIVVVIAPESTNESALDVQHRFARNAVLLLAAFKGRLEFGVFEFR